MIWAILLVIWAMGFGIGAFLVIADFRAWPGGRDMSVWEKGLGILGSAIWPILIVIALMDRRR